VSKDLFSRTSYKNRSRAAEAALSSEVVICLYKQICIALAIKKVRFCRCAKDAEQKIFTKMAKIAKKNSSTNARNAALGLYGLLNCQKETFSAT
jgi:hypothetical protein